MAYHSLLSAVDWPPKTCLLNRQWWSITGLTLPIRTTITTMMTIAPLKTDLLFSFSRNRWQSLEFILITKRRIDGRMEPSSGCILNPPPLINSFSSQIIYNFYSNDLMACVSHPDIRRAIYVWLFYAPIQRCWWYPTEKAMVTLEFITGLGLFQFPILTSHFLPCWRLLIIDSSVSILDLLVPQLGDGVGIGRLFWAFLLRIHIILVQATDQPKAVGVGHF